MKRTLALATVLAAAITIPALGQQTAPAKAPSVVTAPPVAIMKLTAEQAKTWIDKRVYSSDDKNIGEVAAFVRGADDTVSEMHIDIGGFLGLGQTRVRLMPAQFALVGDRVNVNLTATQAKDLPRVQ